VTDMGVLKPNFMSNLR